MRTFIAVNFNNYVKNCLSDLQSSLKQNYSGRWTSKENLHLTLLFLGEINQQDIPQIKQSLTLLSRRHHSFQIEIGRLGCFLRRDAIFWAGLTSGDSQLLAIHQDLVACFSNFPSVANKNQKFNPHITLARRVRLTKSQELAIKNIKFNNIIYNVTALYLMESRRINNKLSYKPLFVANLIT